MNKINIGILLDASGSMEAIMPTMIEKLQEVLNQYPEETKSIWTFNTKLETIGMFDKNLKLHNARCDGGTALYDSAYEAIEKMGKHYVKYPESIAKTLFFIVTDGEDNSSLKHTKESLKKLIEMQTEIYGWKFEFLGANIDSTASAKSIGVSTSHTFTANYVGVANVANLVSRSIGDTISGTF